MNLDAINAGQEGPAGLPFMQLDLLPGAPAADLREGRGPLPSDACLATILSIRPPELEGPSQGGFDPILSNMLGRLADCSLDQIPLEVEKAFARACEFLEVERGGIWSVSGSVAESFTLSYLYRSPQSWLSSMTPARSRSAGKEVRDPDCESDIQGTEFKPSFPWINAHLRQGRTVVFSSLAQLPSEAQIDKHNLLRVGCLSGVIVPFMLSGNVVGAASFGLGWEPGRWPDRLVERFKLVSAILCHAVARQMREQALATVHKELVEVKSSSERTIQELKEQLESKTEPLECETSLKQKHEGILGQSRAIRRVLRQMEQVAPADCAVLVTGETGTGKELIARAIHRLSARRERRMVLVNCAVLPAALVESELFGRERGAFTGAMRSEAGRFELADGSTIFLDEIGELSLEVQSKLLRILQEGEFQRLGNPRTRKVNVRVVAATNRDLAREVRQGRFREDLFYRLQVFPIEVPPLRERMEDLPLLLAAFVREFASRMGKTIDQIPGKALEALQRHSWPGNIRELRNVIERAVILSPGPILVLPDLNKKFVASS